MKHITIILEALRNDLDAVTQELLDAKIYKAHFWALCDKTPATKEYYRCFCIERNKLSSLRRKRNKTIEALKFAKALSKQQGTPNG